MELSPVQRRIRDFYFKEALAVPAGQNFLHAAGRIAPEQVFTLEDLRRHINNPLLDLNYLALFRDGKPVDLAPAAMYKVVQRRKVPFLDRRLLEEHFERGAACVLEGVDILDPAINELATVLDRAHAATFSNAIVFFSQRGNEAYRGHADTDDVLVIHLAGEKRWQLFPRLAPRRVNLTEITDAQLGPPAAELTMRAGDLMWLRSYTPHRVQTVSPWSLHMSFDLCDRTINIETALDALLRQYDRDAAYPHTPTTDLLAKLEGMAGTPRFREELGEMQASERAGNAEFRRMLATNKVNYFDRLLAGDKRSRASSEDPAGAAAAPGSR